MSRNDFYLDAAAQRANELAAERQAHLADLAAYRASHAEGFHLHVLLKPCVNLSIHTASDVRPPTFTNRQ